ncbi:MAG TPA: Hpt domain-containing protein, partial [Steroidobacteraceae bacterium]
AWSIENLVNRVLDNTLTRSPAIIETLRAAVAALPELITQLQDGTPVRADMAGISSRAHALAAGRASLPARSAGEDAAATGTRRAQVPPLPAAAPAPAAPAAAATPAVTDDTLRDIYAREAATHVATVRAYLTREAALPEPHPLPEEVYRACHTLSGSSKMAQARHGIRLAEPLDHWLRRAFDSDLGLATPELALLNDCMAAMESVATHLDESTGYFVNHWQLLERIERADKSLDARIAAEKTAAAAQAVEAEAAAAAPATAEASATAPEAEEGAAVDFDPEVAAIFTDEATELIEASERALSDWRAQPLSAECRLGLKRPLHTLKGGARMAGIMPMGDLSHELETLVMLVDNGTVTTDGALLDAIQASLDELARMREQVANGRRVVPARQMLERLQHLARPGAKAPAATPAPAAPAAQSAPPAPAVAAPPPPPPAAVPLTLTDTDQHSESMLAKFNADLMFAGEVVAKVVASEAAARSGAAPAPRAAPAPPAPVAPAPAAPRETSFAASAATALPLAHSRLAGLSGEPQAPASAALPVVPPGREPVATSGEPKEMARVDADLLDMLLNTSGEASIARARLEQQLGSFDFNLGELSRTVTRLKEQLRSLEIETEAQILHKHEDEGSHRSEFDPLELDRYSSIQQYSRALAETANDVASIQQLLENLAKDTGNLLQQQARTITELQNGLMRTRMVPFQRHVQRLARIVRQAASDTGKRAELTVEGASGELDRQVLERMLPPFEHMLRNAVVHGIEKPEERIRAGKPEAGRIVLEIHRE